MRLKRRFEPGLREQQKYLRLQKYLSKILQNTCRTCQQISADRFPRSLAPSHPPSPPRHAGVNRGTALNNRNL